MFSDSGIVRALSSFHSAKSLSPSVGSIELILIIGGVTACSFCASLSITGLQVHEAIEVVEFLFHPPNSSTEIETCSFDFYVFLCFFFSNSSDIPRSQRRIMRGQRTEIILNLKRNGAIR